MEIFFKRFMLGIMFVLCLEDSFAQVITNEIYKKTPTRELTLRIFSPENIEEGDKSACIVFFFGGGWNSRSLKQFEKHSEVLSQNGMVCIIADYRVKNTDNVFPITCVMDAKSALRYIYANAERLKIDPARVAASGGSAGGHLATAACYVEKFNDPSDDLNVSCKPSALVLFNPVVDNSEAGYGYDRIKDYYPDFSPAHNIKNPVPTIFFVGSEDSLITPDLAKKYKEKCEQLGGRCDLHIYEGRKHGFFNSSADYEDTLRLTIVFLTSIGYINTPELYHNK